MTFYNPCEDQAVLQVARTLQSSKLSRKGGSKAATKWLDESPKRRGSDE